MDWAISHSHAVLLGVFTGVRVDERPTSCTKNIQFQKYSDSSGRGLKNTQW